MIITFQEHSFAYIGYDHLIGCRLHFVIKNSLNICNKMSIPLVTFLLTFRSFCLTINWATWQKYRWLGLPLTLVFIWPWKRALTYCFAPFTFPCEGLYLAGCFLQEQFQNKVFFATVACFDFLTCLILDVSNFASLYWGWICFHLTLLSKSRTLNLSQLSKLPLYLL